MDGGGRLDQPLMRSGPSGVEGAGALDHEPSRPHAGNIPARFHVSAPAWVTAYRRMIGRWSAKIARWPRGFGIAGSALILVGALGYGTVLGRHLPDVINWAKDARDSAANSLGFRIAAVSLSGEKEVSREKILVTAGVNGRASLLFLDADAARARLMENPWIANASVLKLYPDRLQITITERHAFALWQKDGRVSVIADDGTVLEPLIERRYLGLPLVVGEGAQREAKDFLAVIDRHPEIKSMMRASIMVAQRRWDLLLTNGIDVQLPEEDVEHALDKLVELDRTKKLFTRDITLIDLRLPDRVTVRLTDAAAQARDDALKDGKKKKKGGDA